MRLKRGDLRELAEIRLREVAHVSVLRDDAAALDEVHLLEVRAGTDAVADGVQFLRPEQPELRPAVP